VLAAVTEAAAGWSGGGWAHLAQPGIDTREGLAEGVGEGGGSGGVHAELRCQGHGAHAVQQPVRQPLGMGPLLWGHLSKPRAEPPSDRAACLPAHTSLLLLLLLLLLLPLLWLFPLLVSLSLMVPTA
jgi:hypothetical protein